MEKRKSVTLILVAIIFAGLVLIAYPGVSNWWNSYHSSKAVDAYDEAMKEMSSAEYEKIWEAAKEYNRMLAKNGPPDPQNGKKMEDYEKQLKPLSDGMMGYISIPKIHLLLPIYHGTKEKTLSSRIGHVEWTSLPVGGKDTHCVISGHRGLPDRKLFTDIDQLVEGDCFTLKVLDQTLTYEVDQIRVVLPKETGDLQITRGKDYCTLLTCTPYSINTHRLLVRGHRVANDYSENIVNEAIRLDTLLVAGCIAVMIVLFVLSIFFRRTKKVIREME